MLRAIRLAGIPIYQNVSTLAARGDRQLASIAFDAADGRHTLDIDTLLLHEGVIPNTQLSRALGCRHLWDDRQQCLRPEIDRHGESTVPGVFIAGDGATINGAVAAPATATIAVGRILEQMGRADTRSNTQVGKAVAIVQRESAFRPFLDEVYPPRIALHRSRTRQLSAGAKR